MDSTPERISEAATLAALGEAIASQDRPLVPVAISRELADLALAAWRRNDSDEVPRDESLAAWLRRTDAGALALIGMAVESSGQLTEAIVHVKVSAELIGAASGAAERAKRD